ncbi:cytochrome-c peroxidase [Halarcobacter anaerophilus]|uniref:Cytochrome B6 n=1 Tax=Halarcobacter anaerophilus TaxID=877500 RepID=A0A4Q0Y2B9_9BACT|nr:cytochrome-c peroxidase [Halarcobacter anaerophilus]QDF29816.1 cytochrome c peroxidase [Halarcobacter anaerophilus]RXJ62779.1 cytochrome B6 [Halarcobacter anaerophilus]
MLKVFLLCFSFFILNATDITPIPQKLKYDYQKAILGKKLFFDTRLSKDNTISCATCHDLSNGGDDGLSVSFGVEGLKGTVNAPTVLNSVFNFRQFWNGRAKSLEEQALGPIENPVEMGNKLDILVRNLQNTEYKEMFEAIYGSLITKDNLVDAISEFEKTLITPNSRFDKYLLGDEKAITKYEKEGYEIFKNKGCIACHHGVNIGGNHYNKFGAFKEITSDNLGRYDITKKEEDKYYFKVPSLRNVALTSPYFHDGREESLKKAVEIMASVQLGRPITKEEIDKIVAFLKTLTGQLKVIE